MRKTMAKKLTGCKRCSEIRCKLYGFVSGKYTEYQRYGNVCGGPGAICRVTDKEGYSSNKDFGNDFKTFPKYIKTLAKALYNRIF